MRHYAITLRDGVCAISVVEAYGDEAHYEESDFTVWGNDDLILSIPREHIAYIMSYPDTRPKFEVK